MERHLTDVDKSKRSHADEEADQLAGGAHAKAAGAAAEETGEEQAEPLKLTPSMVLIPVLVLTTLVAFGAVPRYFQHETLVSHKQQQLSQAPSVSYIVAAPSPAVQEFVLPGSTEAILTAPVFARVDGYLHLRNVNIGDKVHKGEVLAQIDTPELDKQVQAADNSVKQAKANLLNADETLKKAKIDELTAQANVQKAKTDMEYARLEYVRYDQLARTGAVSNENRDQMLTNYKGALATLESMMEAERSAAAQVKVATTGVQVAQAALQVAQSTRDQYAATQAFKEVKASFDGVVTQRNVDPGALITSGSTSTNTVLFSVAKTDILRIYAYIPEQYISEVHVGQTAALTFQSFPNERFTGTVTYVAGGLNPTSRTLQVEIHVPNAGGRLMPGMYAEVHFEALSKTRLPIVPGSAVQFIADGCFVYTIDNQNHVRMRKVTVARDLGGQVEIQNGISIGEKVVVTTTDDVVDGALVTPVLLAAEPDKQKR